MRSISGSFDLEVVPSRGENLRVEPNGTVVARVENGLRLEELERDGNWIRVRRTGWVFGRSLTRLTPPAPATEETTSGGNLVESAVQPLPQTETLPDVTLDRRLSGGEVSLTSDQSDTNVRAVLQDSTPVRVVDRDGEWVRVQVDGWIRERDLYPGTPEVVAGVSAAEVRARPSEFEGQTLQWRVQFIGIKEGAGLRREIPVGQPYLLARGPVPERGFVYLLLASDQLEFFEDVQPLADLLVVARIRVASSRYLGNPVADLVDVQLARSSGE